jgi:hypothetical protein
MWLKAARYLGRQNTCNEEEPSMKSIRFIAIFIVLTASQIQTVSAESTMRLDYFHTGDAQSEVFSLDELVVEPLPWPGNSHQPIDTLLRGKYLFEITQGQENKVIYSRSFSSIYGEWETTGEAQKMKRTFHESLRFPKPTGTFTLNLKKRDPNNQFQLIWKTDFNADDYMNHQEQANYQDQVIAIEKNGDPTRKVDLLILGDGYTAKEQPAFEKKARELSEYFLSSYPFSKRRNDINVWAIAPPAHQSGVSRPSSGLYIDSPLGATYDAFRSERYVLTYDNKSWRQVASSAPYDAVIMITNSDTYGGGGIYGLYSTAAANSDWAKYLFVHEFGHHFAGLADEYFTSSVAYQAPAKIVEPYEPNVTALLDPKTLKWKHLVDKDTPLPTEWPQQTFEDHSIKIQGIRAKLRADNKPEAEMNALFDKNQAIVEALFSNHKNHSVVGAFEGANYQSKGFYRSSMNCVMFTRTKDFCSVCAEAVEQMIDTYTSQEN